jgi:hypothetical protein
MVTTAVKRTFETRSPRQQQAGRPVDVRMLSEPLPACVVELLDAKQVAGHRRLVERVAKAKRAEVDAAAQVEHARKADREQATKAALAGKPISVPTLPAAEQEVAQAQTVRAALEDAVIESADTLLEAALPRLADAAAAADERIAAALQRRAELLEAALRAGDDVGELRAQAGWITTAAAAGRTVRPFGGANRPDEVNTQIRQAIALAEDRLDREQRRRDQAARAREAEEQQRERERRQVDRIPPRVRVSLHPQGAAVERLPPEA